MYEEDPMKLSFYELDGKRYFIHEGVVYTNDENGERVAVDMLPSSLQLYAECTDHAMLELVICDVKKLPENQALITGEDGMGLVISFIEKKYEENKLKYRTGEKGVYLISAELESIEVPEDQEDGISLEGDDAKTFFEWVEDEVEEDAVACISFTDAATYKKCSDFETTGRYSFYGIVSSPCVRSVSEEIDEPDLNKTSGFDLPLMEQYKTENPRFVQADFPGESYYEGRVDEGWAVKGVLRFIANPGFTNNVYEYGENRIVSPEEKMLFWRDDEEDENCWQEGDDK